MGSILRRLSVRCWVWNRLVNHIPSGARYEFAIRIKDQLTNNQAEYEALCRGLELLLEAGAEAVEAFGDSKVVINQSTVTVILYIPTFLDAKT